MRAAGTGRSGSQVMASYMGLKEGWVDPDGNVEPIEFKGERSTPKPLAAIRLNNVPFVPLQSSTRSR